MKRFIELIKKNRVYILSLLLIFFFFRACSKSTQINRLNRKIGSTSAVIDSLNNEIKLRQQKIDSFPEIIRLEKINIHLEYNEWISSKDRGPQLMELHFVVKDNLKKLQK